MLPTDPDCGERGELGAALPAGGQLLSFVFEYMYM